MPKHAHLLCPLQLWAALSAAQGYAPETWGTPVPPEGRRQSASSPPGCRIQGQGACSHADSVQSLFDMQRTSAQGHSLSAMLRPVRACQALMLSGALTQPG